MHTFSTDARGCVGAYDPTWGPTLIDYKVVHVQAPAQPTEAVGDDHDNDDDDDDDEWW